MNKNFSNPDISILLPFYNAAATLEHCLDSILGQTLENFELLAVNDGSSDASEACVRAKMAGDCRLRLLNPGRVGLVAALNIGLDAARSQLIARMDADDIMHPTRLAQQWNYLTSHPECALLACQVRLFPDELVKDGYREYIRWQNSCLTAQDIRDEIYWESPLAHPAVTFRRREVLALSGYRAGAFPEDYDLWLRMNRAGLKMEKLPEILVDWREGANRLSRSDHRYDRVAFDKLRGEYLAQDSRLHGDRPLVVWGAGRSTRLRARHLLDRGFSLAAWIDVDPNKIGNLVWGVPVEPPEWLDQPKKPFVLSYVTVRGARDENRRILQEMGYLRGRDYLMVG
jgi:glycosyltransferase involved in cell wall biosynthesis